MSNVKVKFMVNHFKRLIISKWVQSSVSKSDRSDAFARFYILLTQKKLINLRNGGHIVIINEHTIDAIFEQFSFVISFACKVN